MLKRPTLYPVTLRASTVHRQRMQSYHLFA
uniref:Uncharacterized protein n=1 Tax=Anguilla anguilla TaxID=7936 RepID=A0A0E9R4K8_ANGAN